MKTGNKEDIVLFLMGQEDRNKLWDLTEHREKRKLNQNAYYWQLAGQVARKTKVTINEIHNRNLRDLGLLARVNGCPVTVLIPDTDEGERGALEAETFHIKPTSKVALGKDGVTYRYYLMLRGSSDYDVKEFSALVDLMVQEAIAQNIEVLTPAELAHMRELEKQAEQRKGDKK